MPAIHPAPQIPMPMMQAQYAKGLVVSIWANLFMFAPWLLCKRHAVIAFEQGKLVGIDRTIQDFAVFNV